MKTLVVALCALAAAAAAAVPGPRGPARRPRSLGHGYAYDTHHHYEEPHVAEYYTVAAGPAHYELGARHVVRTARTQYRVQVPVTYEYAWESAPVTSVHTYAPAHSAHGHYPAAAGHSWGWDEAW